jgi:hypothetical protein
VFGSWAVARQAAAEKSRGKDASGNFTIAVSNEPTDARARSDKPVGAVAVQPAVEVRPAAPTSERTATADDLPF